jgi:hypothetical protein
VTPHGDVVYYLAALGVVYNRNTHQAGGAEWRGGSGGGKGGDAPYYTTTTTTLAIIAYTCLYL